MFRKQNVDARPANRPTAHILHFNNQRFPLENLVKNVRSFSLQQKQQKMAVFLCTIGL